MSLSNRNWKVRNEVYLLFDHELMEKYLSINKLESLDLSLKEMVTLKQTLKKINFYFIYIDLLFPKSAIWKLAVNNFIYGVV